MRNVEMDNLRFHVKHFFIYYGYRGLIYEISNHLTYHYNNGGTVKRTAPSS